MKLEFTTIQLIITLLSSFGFASLITTWVGRRKLKAETQLAITETYSALTGDLREQVRLQGEQILLLQRNNSDMQKKEAEYLKMIGSHQQVERELRKKISVLEAQVKTLQTQNS